MNLSRPFIERPVATLMAALALVLGGGLAYMLLPVAPLPQLDFPVIQVRASLPGASPETMAASVATPLERALGSIAGVGQMTSTSSQGSTRIFLQFDLDKDINDAAREVQAAINASRHMLPSGMPGNPQYFKVNPASAPIMVLALSSNTLDSSRLYDVASTILAQKIAQIEGVGEVEVGGGSLPAVRIELQPRLLAQYGLSLEEVRRAVAATSSLGPRGVLEDGRHRWQIVANDQLIRAEDYRRLQLSRPDQPPVFLADVAEVLDSVEDRHASGFHNDRPAVLLIVRRQPDANIIDTVDAIHAQLPVLTDLLPAGAELAITLDRSPGIRATLGAAQRTLVLATALVVLVVLAFLRSPRAALIPALVVPVALISAFVVMQAMGFSLNNLSLMALIVAAGLVVDDAIVVMENISRHLEQGKSPRRAALDGTREVGFTLVSMSLSLMVVFGAILFMGGFVERLFREFSWTLIAVVAVSLALSISLTPTLCARLLRPRVATVGRASFVRAYQHSLSWALDHGRLLMVLLLATVAMNVYLYVHIPKSMLPSQDTGQLMGFARGDNSLSFQAMEPRLMAFRQALLQDPAVADVSGFIGGAGGVGNAMMLVRLKPLAERGGLRSEEVVARLRQALPATPGARLFMAVDQDIRLDAHGGRGTDHRYVLLASELADLQSWTPRVREALQQLPELVDVDGDVDQGIQQLSLDIDRELARRLGVDMAAVTAVLNNSFSQRQIATLYHDLNQYRVVMEVAPEHTQDPSSLRDLQVIASDGRRVPLAAFARFQHSIAPDRVPHDGLFAAANIAFNLAPGTTLEEAQQAVEQAMARIMLPTGIQGQWGGASRMLQQAQGEQPLLILLALAAVYIVLGMLYESLVHPLTILSTLPSAGVGALLGLQLLGMDFSLVALLGLFLLIGIVKKNAIMMIDFALAAQRQQGLSPRAAIEQAARLRFRPIVMTGAAAILGALPMALGAGEGAEVRQPLGVAIVGGLLVSQILTLYTTPVMYLWMDRLEQRLRRRSPGPSESAGSHPLAARKQ